MTCSEVQLAKKFHPDVNKASDAKERYQDVQEAYDVSWCMSSQSSIVVRTTLILIYFLDFE